MKLKNIILNEEVTLRKPDTVWFHLYKIFIEKQIYKRQKVDQLLPETGGMGIDYKPAQENFLEW